MALNPKSLLKAKERLHIFREQHPKIVSFGKTLNEHAIQPGTIFEITATTPKGKSYTASMRLTPEDVESLRLFVK